MPAGADGGSPPCSRCPSRFPRCPCATIVPHCHTRVGAPGRESQLRTGEDLARDLVDREGRQSATLLLRLELEHLHRSRRVQRLGLALRHIRRGVDTEGVHHSAERRSQSDARQGLRDAIDVCLEPVGPLVCRSRLLQQPLQKDVGDRQSQVAADLGVGEREPVPSGEPPVRVVVAAVHRYQEVGDQGRPALGEGALDQPVDQGRTGPSPGKGRVDRDLAAHLGPAVVATAGRGSWPPRRRHRRDGTQRRRGRPGVGPAQPRR